MQELVHDSVSCILGAGVQSITSQIVVVPAFNVAHFIQNRPMQMSD